MGEKKQSTKRNSKEKKNTKFIYTIILVGAVLGLVLSRYATVSKLQHENAAFIEQRDKLEITRNDLKNNIEEINDSDWLKTQAEERINMRDAQPEQIIELDLSPEEEENKIIKFFKDLIR